MTRETKIGLLVGLAFIIVIGILLSDYNRNEIQGAPLPLVAQNVQNSTATMHNNSTQNEIVPPPAPIVPTRTIQPPQDLRREAPVERAARPTPAPEPSPLAAHEYEPVPGGPVTPIDPVITDTPAPGPVAEAPQAPEPGPTGISGTIPVPPRNGTPSPVPPTPAQPTVNGARQYTAVAGDTLNKLAGRFLGANTKPNREAILAINPSLKANPNNLIVGRIYMIPPKTGMPAVAAVTPVVPPVRPAPVVADPPVKPAPVPAPGGYYTVKENDNLWKIAAEQLNDGSQWQKIKDLNADVLKGKEDLRPNMRLRLPAKTVASVN